MCCAVLRCAVLCGAVLCCAALCGAVLCCAVLRCDVLCCALLHCAVLCCAVRCGAVLCCVVMCCVVRCCAVLCCDVLCCAVLVKAISLVVTPASLHHFRHQQTPEARDPLPLLQPPLQCATRVSWLTKHAASPPLPSPCRLACRGRFGGGGGNHGGQCLTSLTVYNCTIYQNSGQNN